MSRRARHLERPRRKGHGLDEHVSVCGARVPATELVAHPAEATCRTCIRRSRGSAYRLLLLSHAAEALDEWKPPPPVPVVRGAHELDFVSRRALAASGRADDDARRGPRWASTKAAVQRWAAHVDEGASVLNSSVYKYTADGTNITSRGSREGRVSNVERGVDDVVTVAKALGRMFASGMSWGLVSLSPELCRELFVWRHAGRPVYSSKWRECVKRQEVMVEDMIELACKRACGCGFQKSVCATFTKRHMALLMKHGNAELTATLVATGELSVPEAKRGAQ